MRDEPHHYKDNRPCTACGTDSSVGCVAPPPSMDEVNAFREEMRRKRERR